MNYLVVLRGAAGSGKSTYARRLRDKCCGILGKSVCICSADYYFIRSDGEYDFNPKLLGNAHNQCLEEAMLAMGLDDSCSDNWYQYDVVIIDNTNTTKKEYKKYIEAANEAGYKVKEIIVGSTDISMAEEYFKRNVHGCPLDTIQRMLSRFERKEK